MQMGLLMSIESILVISLSNLHAQLERQLGWLWHLCPMSRSWV